MKQPLWRQLAAGGWIVAVVMATVIIYVRQIFGG